MLFIRLIGEKALQSTHCAQQGPWLRGMCRLLLPAQDQNRLSPHSWCQPGRPHWMVPLWSYKKVLCRPDPMETALLARHLCSSCISSSLARRGHMGVTLSWAHLPCFPLSLSEMVWGSLPRPQSLSCFDGQATLWRVVILACMLVTEVIQGKKRDTACQESLC